MYVLATFPLQDTPSDLESFTEIIAPFLDDIGVENTTSVCADLFSRCHPSFTPASGDNESKGSGPDGSEVLLLSAPVCLGAETTPPASESQEAVPSRIADAVNFLGKNTPITAVDAKPKSPKDKRKPKQSEKGEISISRDVYEKLALYYYPSCHVTKGTLTDVSTRISIAPDFVFECIHSKICTASVETCTKFLKR